MIINELEYVQLQQLTDSGHLLALGRTRLGWELLRVEQNAWAREQVHDWRSRHPSDCNCKKLLARMG